MSLLSCLGKGCRLAAIALLLSWLALQPTASAAPGAADLASYNPLRSNAVAETNDLRTVAAAPRQAAPSDALPEKLLVVPRSEVLAPAVPPPSPDAAIEPMVTAESVPTDSKPASSLRSSRSPTMDVASLAKPSAPAASRTSMREKPAIAQRCSPAPAMRPSCPAMQPSKTPMIEKATVADVSGPAWTVAPSPPAPGNPSEDRPIKIQLVQALTQPAPPLVPQPEPLPTGDALTTGGGNGMTEVNLPLAGMQPQVWMTCESPCRCGVTCPPSGCPRPECRWQGTRMIPWQVFAQGEYVGPARAAHVPEYRLRVDDFIRMVYGFTGQPSPTPYRLAVGDIVQVESNGDPKVNRTVTVQPDGMVTLRYLGQVRAAGFNLEELQTDLDSRYARYIREPAVNLAPMKLNSRLEELRQAVDQRYGPGGQGVFVRVTPAGTVQLPSIGSIPVQGLTLDEVKQEIEARYSRRFFGVEVTPVLDRRAPRYLFVLGEVRNPGRYELEGPTTAMQAIAMAGGWNVGAELRQAVVFRRDDCWRLMATRLHLRGAVRGTQPCPPDEIWLRDSDILLLPKSHLLEADDMIELLFTRGLYGVAPFNMTMSWTRLTTL